MHYLISLHSIHKVGIYFLSPLDQTKPKLNDLPRTHQNNPVCGPKVQCSSSGQQWLYENLDGGEEEVGPEK